MKSLLAPSRLQAVFQNPRLYAEIPSYTLGKSVSLGRGEVLPYRANSLADNGVVQQSVQAEAVIA